MALMSARAARAADADADRTVRLAAPSPRAVVRVVAIVVACAVLLYLAWRLRDVLRLVVISVFLALALLPVVDGIDARVRVPRAAIVLSLYAALAAGVIVVGVVKKLEERGLVRRVAGADDQRTIIRELTEKGRALIADMSTSTSSGSAAGSASGSRATPTAS